MKKKWTVHKKQGVAALSFDITPVKGLKYTPSFSVYGILDEEKKQSQNRMIMLKEQAGEQSENKRMSATGIS